MRKLKSLIDKSAADVKALDDKIPSLTSKGYPQQMIDWAVDKNADIKLKITAAQQVYGSEVVKVVSNDSSADLEASRSELQTAIDALEHGYDAWKKSEAVELKKFVA